MANNLRGALGGGALGDGGLGLGGSATSDQPVYPIPFLRVALTDPLTAFPEVVDITQWCKSIDATYGRQHELQQIEAQTLKATMDNVTGLFSGYNFQSPFTNLMPYVDSTLSQGNLGSWQEGPDTQINATGRGLDGVALFLQAVVSTDMTASTGASNVFTPVTEGDFYTGFASFEVWWSLAGTRACTVGIAWYDDTFTLISTSTGPSINDVTGSYTKATVTDQAPSGAVWAALVPTVLGVVPGGAPVEGHLVCRMGITKRYVDPSGAVLDVSAWSPGGFGLTAGRVLSLGGSTGGDEFPLGFGYLEKNVLTVQDELNKTSPLEAADAFKFFANTMVTSSLYPGLVMLDDPALYWRLGDPVNTTLVSDFSGNANMGVVSGPWTFQAPSLLDQDQNLSMRSGLETFPTGSFPVVPTITATPTGNPDPPCFITGAEALTIELLYKASSGGGVAVNFAGTGGGSIELVITDTNTVAVVINSSIVFTGSANVNDGNIHHLVLAYDDLGDWVVYVDGVVPSGGVGTATPHLIPGLFSFSIEGGWNQYYDEVAVYPYALSPTQVAAHYDLSIAGFTIPGGSTTSDILILLFLLAAGFPLWMMSFEEGISQIVCPTVTPGSSSILTIVSQIVATEQGLLYQDRSGFFVFLNRHYAIQAPFATQVQATFENAEDSNLFYLPAGFQPVNDDEDLWNDVPTQTQNGPLHDVQDAESISHFGPRSLQGYTSMLYANDLDTVALGQWLLAAYSTPYTRIRSMQVSSAANRGAAIPQMLQRDLLDLIAVIYHPQDAGDDLDQQAQIEQISLSIKPMLWVVTYQLTPYIFGSNFWFTLGDPVLGVLAGLGSDAANRLAF